MKKSTFLVIAQWVSLCAAILALFLYKTMQGPSALLGFIAATPLFLVASLIGISRNLGEGQKLFDKVWLKFLLGGLFFSVWGVLDNKIPTRPVEWLGVSFLALSGATLVILCYWLYLKYKAIFSRIPSKREDGNYL
ncbi:hypothetical protein [Geoalkalibacter subterraneus]|uniref:Uncharacterized protein n=1 Tax=Geoalkalibacter subterraneus TaxID=483547 RepID=A0A0B5FXH9_9BACT|nr:hypothetical protein [Geoalkalibacter subterraneus]AJF08296.1 hypothetical protein GSUB_17625 [Geoalkalibacter subterraneus]